MDFTTYVTWGEQRMRVTWMPGAPLPPKELITSASGFCFMEKKLMVVQLDHRGPDIPGGHREGDEEPHETFAREAREEGCVEGRLTYLGVVEVDHRENPAWQPGGKYPQVGYMALYRMEIERLLPFEAAFEASRRFFVEPSELPGLHRSWNPIMEHGLAAALQAAEQC